MTKAGQARLMAWRFKVLQQAAARSRNIARTCRHFGISRQAFYRWKRRYAAHGETGLADRPSTPHRSPGATPREVVSKVVYLRQHYETTMTYTHVVKEFRNPVRSPLDIIHKRTGP